MLLACFFTIITSGQTVNPKQFGQQTGFIPCGAVEHTQYLQQKGISLSQNEFEEWLAPKAVGEKLKRWQKDSSGEEAIVIIPVVVHIIHNGDAEGVNENISNEQVMSQITVLNQDFRRLENTRGFNSNPVGADMGIEFRLAQRDPLGLKTSGIVRHDFFGQAGESWTMTQLEEIVKPQTQWDPDGYLNIWVVGSITHTSGYPLAGYAQFPMQSGLEGLGYDNLAVTDGVVIAAPYFGSAELHTAGFYRSPAIYGRAAVHEIGHFFGLRHIWGDGDCSATDYCDDTPSASGPNSGCPNGKDSCESPGQDMIQNYMDYTADACKNVFTQNQKDRLMAVLEYSPRRHLLKSSLTWIPPDLKDNDAILEIAGVVECGALWPEIIIRNTGNNELTTAVINYGVDGSNTQEYFWTGSLGYGEQEVIRLLPQNETDGEHAFTAGVKLVNTNEVAEVEYVNHEFSISPDFVADGILIKVDSPVLSRAVYWEINDLNGVLVERATFQSNKSAEWNVALQSGCYTFSFADVAGEPVDFDFNTGTFQVWTKEGKIVTYGGGRVNADYSFNFGITNISPASLADSIIVYPNPTEGELNVALSNSVTPDRYIVYNGFGQAIFKGEVGGVPSFKIDASSYNGGLYFIKFEKGEESAMVKFIRK